MLSPDALGASISPARDVQGAVDKVRRVEELGYESVWINQLAHTRDTGAILAAYALNTSRIGLGTSVLPIYTRHPTAMAQLAQTVDELSGGRFRLGIGLSHRVTVENLWGLKLEEPVLAMREYVEILRSSFRTGGADLAGKHFTAHWQYSAPRNPDLPIVIGALGPRMLEQAGEIADGVSLWMCSPGYIENEVVPRVRKGREKAGKSMDGFVIAASFAICLTDDVQAALDTFRPSAGMYANLPFYRRALEGGGFAEDLAGDAPTDRMLLELAGIGDENAVRDAVRRYRDAGANLPVVGPFNAPGSAGVDAALEAVISS